MSIRLCCLFAAGTLALCLSAKLVAQGQVAPDGRPYPPYGNAKDGQAPSSYPNRQSAPPPRGYADQPQAEPPRQDVPAGPAPAQGPPAPPFRLSPQEEADLDKTLDAWEKKNGALKSFKCDFQRFQYDPVLLPKRPGENEIPKQRSNGEIKYVAPDKGMLRETEGEVNSINPKTNQIERKKLELFEHWACDGKTLYKVDYLQKVVEEVPIPAELQGKGITQGPLPFVFGAKAAELKARYFIRPVAPPPGDTTHAWLEIRPKYRRDAENFSKVELILRTNDMFPEAIQITGTNGTDRDVYMLAPKGWLNLPDWNEFSPSPFGFKHVKNQPPAAPAAQSGGPNAPPPGGEAQRFAPNGPNRR